MFFVFLWPNERGLELQFKLRKKNPALVCHQFSVPKYFRTKIYGQSQDLQGRKGQLSPTLKLAIKHRSTLFWVVV